MTRIRRTALFASIALASLAGAGLAQAAPVDTVKQLTAFDPPDNSSTAGGPAIAYNPSTGKTLTVFVAPQVESNYGLLQVGLTSADGSLEAAPVPLPTNVPAWCPSCSAPPSVAAGGEGGWLVVWESRDETETDSIIGGQLIDSAGQPVGDNFILPSNTNYRDIETVDAAWSDEDSRYLVTWKADVENAFPGAAEIQQLVGRFIGADGSGLGNDFLVTDIADGIDNSQEVEFGNGIWVAVGATFSGSANRVVGRVVEAGGPVGTVYDIGEAGSYGPSITFNPETEDFLVTYRVEGSNLGHGRFLGRDGSPAGGTFTFGAAAAVAGRPRVASAGADGYLAVWTGSEYRGVWGTEIGLAGGEEGAPQLLGEALSSPNQAWRPAVTYSACQGRYLTVWGQKLSGALNYYSRPWFMSDPLPEPCPAPPVPPTPPVSDPDLSVSIGGAKKARAGKTFKVGIRVVNRELLTRSGSLRSGPASSVRTCLILPGTLFVARAAGAGTKPHRACWTLASLATGTSVDYRALVRVSKSATATRAVARIRASVTASGQSGDPVTSSGARQIRILKARTPRPQPPTG